MSGRTAFPPPIGWIPGTVAVAVATVAALFAVVPQFATRPVAVNGNALPGTSGQGSAGQGGGQGTIKGQGRTVTTGGTTGATGGNVGPAPGGSGAISCAAGRNGGATAPGVTATRLHVASTIVTTGVGSGFLGEAVDGMQAAVNEANAKGGVCGRELVLDTVNSGWDRQQGGDDIATYINSGNVFALVGEPDSEGLEGALQSHTIDRAQIPVVGTDGMLKDQYTDPWVWPVAASTVTNMHIIADYAVRVLHAHKFGIVYDTHYKFGGEGAKAFDAEVARLTGSHIPGADTPDSCASGTQFCGIDADQSSYSDAITAFNSGCTPACDVVVMLLEPAPMETWMKGEVNATENGVPTWYKYLFGGEPLFDDKFGYACGSQCAKMTVWTGYQAAIQPFDARPGVSRYVQALHSVCTQCDAHNEFTEGAYLGTRLFIEAVTRLQDGGQQLTRDTLRQELNNDHFDLGLTSAALAFGSGALHLANGAMAAFADNASGSFNGWNYLGTGFLPDPARGSDLQ